MGKNVAIVGITGVVGEEMLNCLERRNFPVDELRVMASARSVGKKVKFRDRELSVIEAAAEAFAGIDIALFAVEADQARQFAPAAVKAGAVVIDNSSAYRMSPDCPLVVPEINPQDATPRGIIANPNCSTIIMNVPVYPLHRVNPIKRLVVSTYQAASGAGRPAMEELAANARAWAAGENFTPRVLPYQLFMNVFSHNADIGDNGYNGEEMKMTQETQKIFHAPDIRVTATCVRVPTLRAHCEAVNIEFSRPMSEREVYEILATAPGVTVLDDRAQNRSPQPLDATGQGNVLVGRIRQDISLPDKTGIALFVAGDQILKGAALNAVQIAELIIRPVR
ncbi:aspartate-semialdehyde dehydrogenase [Planctomycetales bacterium]|nr:aspartate-semialdehyde dehydrogenase [Planctomycetales bacterium]GHV21484.1 aspartate-semialdehyde dehydrogenase [Planctomycetales bacterium]